MQSKRNEHLLSILVVTAVFIGMIINFGVDSRQAVDARNTALQQYLPPAGSVDFRDPQQRALLKETLDIYFPENQGNNEALVLEIQRYLAGETAASISSKTPGSALDGSKLLEIFGMLLSFILVYVLVMGITYYGVQTLAIFRFTRMKQERESYLAELWTYLQALRNKEKKVAINPLKIFVYLGKACAKGLLYFILFSPAYVIAYSFKTRFDTDSFFFMVLLGVISNGLLITYAQKFFTFLVGESRKGYVETAVVKNLHNDYSTNEKSGIPLKNIFALRKAFPGHVFEHIYINAHQQYLAAIKEQASFLISGLVIIEMALNIQGHLCYELMQNILYRRFDVVLVIVLGIFLVVKATEIFTDSWIARDARRYANEEGAEA